MKIIQMKKSVFVSSLLAVSLLFGSVGVFASSGLEKIQAYLNHDIKFTVDGKAWTPKDVDGNELSALVYEGSSYVPAKAVAEKLGGSVKWDGETQTIKLTTSKGDSNTGIPYKDGQDSSNTTPTPKPVDISGGIWSFPGDFDKSKVEGPVKEKALQFIKLYADALKTGDTSDMEKFVKTYSSNNGYSGWEKSIEKIKEKVTSARSVNKNETLEKYAQELKSITVSDLNIKDSSKTNGYLAHFSISFEPKNWDLYSTTWVYFSFSVIDDKDGKFELDYVTIL